MNRVCQSDVWIAIMAISAGLIVDLIVFCWLLALFQAMQTAAIVADVFNVFAQ